MASLIYTTLLKIAPDFGSKTTSPHPQSDAVSRPVLVRPSFVVLRPGAQVDSGGDSSFPFVDDHRVANSLSACEFYDFLGREAGCLRPFAILHSVGFSETRLAKNRLN
jgi:hypothetical protein